MPDGHATVSDGGAQNRRSASRRRSRKPRHERGHNRGRKGPVFGALDLGTNNCRLLVARPSGDSFQVVGSFSRIVRLGEGLHADGRLLPAAMDRTIDALHVCARIMRRHDVARARCIATEACRSAANAPEFLDRIALETGLLFEAVTSEEEARLTLAGCAELLDRGRPHALVFDIGGGSTEVMWLGVGAETAEPLGILSLPFGVVTLAERAALDAGGTAPDPLDSKAFRALVDEIDGRLDPFDRDHCITQALARDAVSLLGTSGTITTLGGLYLGLERYDRSKVDGLVMKTPGLLDISTRLSTMTLRERAQNGCIGNDRADLMVMGCAILEAICRRWPVPFVRAADRGIREGLLCAMVSDHGARRRKREDGPVV